MYICFDHCDAGVGGAILTPESAETPSSEKKMIGSVLIVEADNINEVRKAIEEDVYYTSGVVSAFLLSSMDGLHELFTVGSWEASDYTLGSSSPPMIRRTLRAFV